MRIDFQLPQNAPQRVQSSATMDVGSAGSGGAALSAIGDMGQKLVARQYEQNDKEANLKARTFASDALLRATVKLDELSQQPDAGEKLTDNMLASFDEEFQGTISSLDSYNPQLKDALTVAAGDVRRRIAEQSIQKQAQVRSANSLALVDTGVNNFANLAAQGHLTVDEADYQAQQLISSSSIPGERRASVLSASRESIAKAYLDNLVVKDPGAVASVVDSGRFNEWASPEVINSARTRAEAQLRADESRADAAVSQGTRVVESLQDQINKGQILTQDQIAGAKQTLGNLAPRAEGRPEMSEIIAALEQLPAMSQLMQTAAAESPAAMNMMIADLRKRVQGPNSTQGDVQRLATMEKAMQETQRRVESGDALGRAAEAGTVQLGDFLGPLMSGNPEQWTQAAQDRLSAASVTQQHYGMAEFPLMTKSEQDMFAQQWPQMSPENKVNVLSRLVQPMDDRQVGQAAQILKPVSEYFGPLVVLSKEDPMAARNIIIGAGSTRKAPDAGVLNQAFFDTVGNAIPAENAEVRKQVLSAVKAHYMGLAEQKNLTDGVLNTDALSDSIKAVVGPVATLNGSSVLSFKNGGAWVTSDKLNDYVDELTDDQVKAMNGGELPLASNGQPVTMDQIRGYAAWKTAGDGRYNLIAPDGGYYLDKNNQPFVLDVRSGFGAWAAEQAKQSGWWSNFNDTSVDNNMGQKAFEQAMREGKSSAQAAAERARVIARRREERQRTLNGGQ